MGTVSHPVCERIRRRRPASTRSLLSQAFLALFLTVAPSTIEPWRLDPVVRNSVTLAVGEPVRRLEPAPFRRRW